MSVTFAPRERIRVNASWPGVSMKHDAASIDARFVRADVLRDSACFAGGHFGFADRVEKAGFAVIHVPHHRDYRRTRLLIRRSELPLPFLPERSALRS